MQFGMSKEQHNTHEARGGGKVVALESPDQGVRSEVGPFGYCKGSGLCSECEGPGDCVQTSDMSSLTAGREQRVGHILAILWLRNK